DDASIMKSFGAMISSPYHSVSTLHFDFLRFVRTKTAKRLFVRQPPRCLLYPNTSENGYRGEFSGFGRGLAPVGDEISVSGRSEIDRIYWKLAGSWRLSQCRRQTSSSILCLESIAAYWRRP